jgi:THO complex subunit 2
MDLEPILQYIINKLMRGESDDLTILSRVIQRMYGVDTVENNGVSDAQLEAYATGRQMTHESFWTTQILLSKPTDDPGNKSKSAPMDKAKSTKKSLPRLISALRDTKLAILIWIALAQTRQGVVDKLVERQPDTPLKALGLMHDKVSSTPHTVEQADCSGPRHFHPIWRFTQRATHTG